MKVYLDLDKVLQWAAGLARNRPLELIRCAEGQEELLIGSKTVEPEGIIGSVQLLRIAVFPLKKWAGAPKGREQQDGANTLWFVRPPANAAVLTFRQSRVQGGRLLEKQEYCRLFVPADAVFDQADPTQSLRDKWLAEGMHPSTAQTILGNISAEQVAGLTQLIGLVTNFAEGNLTATYHLSRIRHLSSPYLMLAELTQIFGFRTDEHMELPQVQGIVVSAHRYLQYLRTRG